MIKLNSEELHAKEDENVSLEMEEGYNHNDTIDKFDDFSTNKSQAILNAFKSDYSQLEVNCITKLI